MSFLKNNERLTVLLTLKDRSPFTFRWMRYANAVHFPFKIFIADGGSDDRVPEVLGNKTNFPELNYEYVRYPFDRTYTDFYHKVENALKRITTPYVVMVDNDDFYIPAGMTRAVDFLESHLDYVSCRGEYIGFDVRSRHDNRSMGSLYGELIVHGPQYHFINEPSNESESPTQRVKNCFVRWTSNWNNIQRTDQLRYIWNIVVALDLKDIYLQELLTDGLRSAMGKTKCDDYPYYYRQYGVVDSGSTDEVLRQRGDFYERMFAKTWSNDIWNVINAVARMIVANEHIKMDQASVIVRDAYQTFLSRHVLLALNAKSSAPSLKAAIKEFIQYRVLKMSPWKPVCRLCRFINSITGFYRTALPTSADDEATRFIRHFLANPPDSVINE